MPLQKNLIHEMEWCNIAYLPTFHAVALQFSGSDRGLVAHFTSCLFLALLLICNVSVCSLCSQQTNIKLGLKPHRQYKQRYEASFFFLKEIAPILGLNVFGLLNF